MREARTRDRNIEIISVRKIIETTDAEYFHWQQSLSNWLGQNGVEVIKELWGQGVKRS